MTSQFGMTEHQQTVSGRVLDDESTRREHVVVSLSGGHAYGFPSPDSDLDLKAIHVEPTARLVGLNPAVTHADRMEIIDGVEIDYTSNELGPAIAGILGGNGNYLERVLGLTQVRTSPLLAQLAPLVTRSLSKKVYRHYLGFAGSQMRSFEQAEAARAKNVLYVLRTALTGAHLLLTGELVVDLGRNLERYGFGAATELIEIKRAGEKTTLAADVRERWAGELKRAFVVLHDAHARSVLPDEPANVADLDAWLIEVRRRRFD